MFIKKYLKWISTFFVLTGILLTNLNIYPLNIFLHGAGVLGWTISGFILKEKSIQPLYYPSINKKNLKDFQKKFNKEFKSNPNHLSLLSYDLVGLIYYLSLSNELNDLNKLFKKRNSFKGKIGVFNINNNKINHKLNLYKIEDGEIKEIF